MTTPYATSDSTRKLWEAAQAVEGAVRDGRQRNLRAAVAAVQSAVQSLLDNEFKLSGLAAHTTDPVKEDAAGLFTRRLVQVLHDVGYATPPPPEADVLVATAVDAIRAADGTPARRGQARDALFKLKHALHRLPDGDALQRIRPVVLSMFAVVVADVGVNIASNLIVALIPPLVQELSRVVNDLGPSLF